MGKIIAFIIVIALAVGAWWIFSKVGDTTTPTTKTVNEPIDQARDLEEKAASPSRGTISE